jgi:hypothetical protein
VKKQIIFLLDQASIPSATGNGNRVLVFALCNILIKLNYKLNLIFIDSMIIWNGKQLVSVITLILKRSV